MRAARAQASGGAAGSGPRRASRLRFPSLSPAPRLRHARRVAAATEIAPCAKSRDAARRTSNPLARRPGAGQAPPAAACRGNVAPRTSRLRVLPRRLLATELLPYRRGLRPRAAMLRAVSRCNATGRVHGHRLHGAHSVAAKCQILAMRAHRTVHKLSCAQ
jgi:hypothetical protein